VFICYTLTPCRPNFVKQFDTLFFRNVFLLDGNTVQEETTMDLYEIALGIEKIRIRKSLTGKLTPWYLSSIALALGIWRMHTLNVPLASLSASLTLRPTATTLLLLTALLLSLCAFIASIKIINIINRRAFGTSAWCLVWFCAGMLLAAPIPQRLPPTEQLCTITAQANSGRRAAETAIVAKVLACSCETDDFNSQPFLTRISLTPQDDVQRGDIFKTTGTFSVPQSADTPGTFDARDWLFQQNILLVFKRNARFEQQHPVYEPITILEHGTNELRRKIDELRLSTYTTLAPYSPYGLQPALALGISKTLDKTTRNDFASLGIAHILAVSGLHFGMIALALTWLIHKLLNLFPNILRKYGRKHASAILSIALLWIYILVVGAPISAQRALIMLYACLIGRLSARKPESLRTLTLASTLILLLDPNALFAPSFQLSFGAVLGIFCSLDLFQRPTSLWIKQHIYSPRKQKFCETIASTLIMTFGSTLVTAPFCIWHFGQLPLLGALANLAAIPFVSFVMLPLSLLSALTTSIPIIGIPVAQVTGLLESAFVNAMHAFSEFMPLAYVRLPPHHFVIITFSSLAVLTVLYNIPSNSRRIAAKCSIICSILVILISLIKPYFWYQTSDLRITFLAMGQADATFIEFPDHSTMLIDAGNALGSDYDMGQARVIPYLQTLGIERIDTLVLTHGDYDHYAAMTSIIDTFEIGSFWFNGDAPTDAAYLRVLEMLHDKNIPVVDVRQLPQTQCHGQTCIQRLWPDTTIPIETDSKNERSIVLKLDHLDFSALFMADAGLPVETALARKYGSSLDVALLKAGHHGSKYATGEAWLDLTSPQFVVFSAGSNNRYHFPSVDTLRRCRRINPVILRTDTQGSLRFTTDGKRTKIESAL